MKIGLNRGFTLVELFISSAIVFLVGIAVYSAFSNGVKVWHRANINRQLERDINIGLTKLSRDLRNTFEFSEIPFEGTEKVIFSPALINTAPLTEEPQYEVGRIVYFFDEDESALYKEVKTYPEVYRNEGIEDEYITPAISKISQLTFSYCYRDGKTGKYEWKDSWEKEEQDSIPQAVNVDFVFKKDEDETFSFTKTIFIPIGTGEQKIELNASIGATKNGS